MARTRVLALLTAAVMTGTMMAGCSPTVPLPSSDPTTESTSNSGSASPAESSSIEAGDVPLGGALGGEPLLEGQAMYPRLIELTQGAHRGTIIASVMQPGTGERRGTILSSTDQGKTFTEVGSIVDPAAEQGLCCATIYELPQQVGDLEAGTLLWSASVGADAGDARTMTVPVYASQDAGATWKKLGTAITASNAAGWWEPEFSVAADGQLVMHISDESQQPTHSQTLVLLTSRDGVTWSKPRNTVALADPALRPGMPVVRRLPDKSYLMSYEICGPGQGCRHMVRRSSDGLNWGSVTDPGKPVVTADGLHFVHAPTISWYDDGSADGRLVAVGQMLVTAEGVEHEQNGLAMLVQDGAAEDPWLLAKAPLGVNQPYDNYCPNYSSSLLPLPESKTLVELASAYDDVGVCRVYVASGELPS